MRQELLPTVRHIRNIYQAYIPTVTLRMEAPFRFATEAAPCRTDKGAQPDINEPPKAIIRDSEDALPPAEIPQPILTRQTSDSA